MFEQIFTFIKKLYPNETPVPLHAPVFLGNEKKYLNDCIDSTFVSTVGPFVGEFEKKIAQYTGAKYAISTVNGTAALHAALLIAGVRHNDEVLTQALTFVATGNAISYCGAHPVLIDSDPENLGLCPSKLKEFLNENCYLKNGEATNRRSGRRFAACVPMHVFGHSAHIKEIISVCSSFQIPVIEDAAEALGSYKHKKHLGTFGLAGILSFNGNKVLTTGGGGMILTDDADLGAKLKHLTTTARLSHAYEFLHDQVGYNYRMPNINAALGCAQIEYLDKIVSNKRETANRYEKFFTDLDMPFLKEPGECVSNYWLNAILLKNIDERDLFIQGAIKNQITVRPLWALLNELPMFKSCLSTDLSVAQNFRSRLVNIPSGYRGHS